MWSCSCGWACAGQVIAGEIGSGPFGYTAVGEQVGMAQRMESVARRSDAVRTRRKDTKDRVSLAALIVALSAGSIAVLAGLVLGGAAYLLIAAALGP